MAVVFQGNLDHHYTADFVNLTVEEGGKRLPAYKKAKGAPTVEAFQRHLDGKLGLLVVPVTRAGACRWGKIDIDEYPVDATAYAKKIARWGLPLVVELTKSGGVHLAHYSPTTESAGEIRTKLVEWAVMVGCSSKVEIFPKQERLMDGEDGSGINLPYFGGDNAKNYAIDQHGNKLTVDQWLALITTMPAKAKHTPGQVNVEAAADLLAQHWTDGQRDNINLAAGGAMIRAGIDEGLAQEILSKAQDAGADPEQRKSIADMMKSMEQGKRMPGFNKLAELIGKDPAAEFMRLVGGKPPPDPLPIDFAPVSAEWINVAPPALTYCIKPLLPTGVVGMVVAEGGAGKTTFNLRMSVAVAGGRSLFGMETACGRVVYIGCEDHETSLRRRIHWIVNNEKRKMMEEGCSPEELERFEQNVLMNLTVQSAVGYELHLIKTFAGQASQGPVVDALIEKLPRPLTLLTLDPISRLNGAEENSNSVGTALVNAAERIAREVVCTVLLSHHTGKASAKDRDTSLYAARGASGFVDAARSSIRLMQATQDDVRKFTNVPPELIANGDLVQVIHNKSNEGPRAKPFWLRRQALDFDLFEPELSSGAAQHSVLLNALHSWYVANGSRPWTRVRMDDVETRADMFKPNVLSRNAARKVLARAMDEGDILPSGLTAEGTAHPLLKFRENYDPGEEL